MKDDPNSGKPGDVRGHLDENEIALYAEHLHDPAVPVPERLIHHVASCPYCRSEVMAVSDLLDELPDLAEEPETGYGQGMPASPKKILSARKIIRSVAAIAAIFVVSWVIEQVVHRHPDNQPAVADNPKTSAPAGEPVRTSAPAAATESAKGATGTEAAPKPDTILYASAFIPEATYESLIGAKYRAAGDPRVKGPSPATVVAPGDSLTVTWTPDPNELYRLLVIDNTGRTVRETDLPSGGRYILKTDLKPGLYYWKFLGHEDLWMVGKFKVMHR